MVLFKYDSWLLVTMMLLASTTLFAGRPWGDYTPPPQPLVDPQTGYMGQYNPWRPLQGEGRTNTFPEKPTLQQRTFTDMSDRSPWSSDRSITTQQPAAPGRLRPAEKGSPTLPPATPDPNQPLPLRQQPLPAIPSYQNRTFGH
ncbi:MAG: hypothetical protein HQL49_03525 [Gammaproteobacteria bacterium]|nr:hypothetical protein [Gammaproteobacteria bacterium]